MAEATDSITIEMSTARFDLLKNALPADLLPALETTGTLIDLDKKKPIPEVPGIVTPGVIENPRPVGDAAVDQILLANSIADLMDDDSDDKLLKSLFQQDGNTLRELALGFDTAKVTETLKTLETATIPPTTELPPPPTPASLELEDVVKEPHVDERVAAAMVAVATPMRVVSPTLDEENIKVRVKTFKRKLFKKETAAFLAGMSSRGELAPVGDSTDAKAVQDAVSKVLQDAPAFSALSHGVMNLMGNVEALQQIDEAVKLAAFEQLKALQTLQAIAPVPEVVPVLLDGKITSAFQMAQLPEATLSAQLETKLGEEGAVFAKQMHSRAKEIVFRNDEALTAMVQLARGTGIAAIDGTAEKSAVLAEFRERLTGALPEHVNLEQLFGSLDFCECSDCNSVMSPAAYFVELLQYLENNNLTVKKEGPKGDEQPADSSSSNPLEVLLARRPDLQYLQLTCANTKTELPYIDLANEVMESYVVYLNQADRPIPMTGTISPFNTLAHSATSVNDGEGQGGSTAEQLTSPQNTQYEAYRTMRTAVFPSTDFPFNQPVFAIRKFLEFLKTNAAEINDVFAEKYVPPRWTKEKVNLADSTNQIQAVDPVATSHTTSDEDDDDYEDYSDEEDAPTPPPPANTFCPEPICEEDRCELIRLHEIARQNAADAEALDLTLEEYIILTKQAFWPAKHFAILYGDKASPTDYEHTYREEIGLKSKAEYWGFSDDNELDGLQSVKEVFLPRSGISYSDLVELLQTEYINPDLPKGRDLVILESLRSNYTDLFHLVQDNEKHAKAKYAKVVERLESQGWFESVSQLTKAYYAHCGLHSHDEDQHEFCCRFYKCTHKRKERCDCEKRWFRYWIYRNFARLGCLSVLISEKVEDDCDISHVRLLQLKGIPLAPETCDRFHCFLRLWRKLGWTMAELDCALRGFGVPKIEDDAKSETPSDTVYVRPQDVDDVDWEDFADRQCPDGKCGRQSCSRCNKRLSVGPGRYGTISPSIGRHSRRPSGNEIRFDDRGRHGEPSYAPSNRTRQSSRNAEKRKKPKREYRPAVISVQFLHEVVALKKLVELTDLTVTELLALWADIDTRGENSLYKKLFLNHNMMALDPVFKPDEDGNHLASYPPERLSEHKRVILSALRIKMDDLNTILKLACVGDILLLSTVSTIYRYNLLAKILSVPVSNLSSILQSLVSPWIGPDSLLQLLDLWKSISEQGFTFKQLSYVISDVDDPKKPFMPALPTVLKLAKSIYEFLTEIDTKHPLPKSAEEATSEVILNKLALVRDDAAVLGPKVIAFLEGTNTYSTNAPKGIQIAIPEKLKKKITYTDGPDAKVQVTGQLTAEEQAEAKALSSKDTWGAIFDRVAKQAAQYFRVNIAELFDDKDAAASALVSGDIEGQTASQKRFYYLQHLIPFVRRVLSRRAVIEPTSVAANLTSENTEFLLRNVVKLPHGESGLTALLNLKNTPEAKADHWDGYLIVAETATYSLGINSLVDECQPPDLVLDGDLYPFFNRCEDPSNLYLTNPIQLLGGRSYKVRVFGQPGTVLKWQTSRTAVETIPTSSILPEYSTEKCSWMLKQLAKISVATSGFELSTKEIEFFASPYSSGFDGLDLNKITWDSWRGLASYTTFKKSLPKTTTLVPLIDLFRWAATPLANPAQLVQKIKDSTDWSEEAVLKLVAKENFGLQSPEHFRNEKALVRIQKVLRLYETTGVEIESLFCWAKPRVGFGESHEIALDIEQAAKALFSQTEWEAAAKATYDKLRAAQNNALVKYLTAHPRLKAKNVVDADSLFEYFLIDVQMCPCMQTTRMIQATSSIQHFVQRCFLGLEPDVPAHALDRRRWELMGKYRLSELNKKVFLWPEMVLKSSLRDDKSPLFTEFEGEIAGKSITPEGIVTAVKNYVSKLAGLANLDVQAIHEQNDSYSAPFGGQAVNQHRIHVFARTRSIPFKYYHRYFDVPERCWYPWETVDIDIPVYEPMDEDPSLREELKLSNFNVPANMKKNGLLNTSGFLIPFTYDNRLILAFPMLVQKTGTVIDPVLSDKAGVIKQDLTAVVVATQNSNAAKDKDWVEKSWQKVDTVFANRAPTATDIADEKVRDGVTKKWNDTSPLVKNEVKSLISEAIARRDPFPDPNSVKIPDTFESFAQSGIKENGPKVFWDIRMGWSEYRDGKWTTRTLSGESASFQLKEQPQMLPIVQVFQFYPGKSIRNNVIDIDVYHPSKGEEAVATFRFDGNEIVLVHATAEDQAQSRPSNWPLFYFQKLLKPMNAVTGDQLRAWQIHPMMEIAKYLSRFNDRIDRDEAIYEKLSQYPLVLFIDDTKASTTLKITPKLWWDPLNYDMYNGEAVGLLSAVSNTTDISKLQDFLSRPSINRETAFGLSEQRGFSELSQPYSLYNWEIGFHIPMLLVETLASSQQFELAIKVFNLIFDPTSGLQNDDPKDRWKFLPFRQTDQSSTIENLLRILNPNTMETMDGVINQWRNKPHFPHVIARARPIVYMKWAAMKYIEIVVGLGDFYFQQNSLESIPQALQCYILASHVYGRKGQKIGVRGKKKPETFATLSGKWDSFSNAMIGIELAFPFVSAPQLEDSSTSAEVDLPNIFGFATSRYFCIPNNKQITDLRDLIDDRLYKVRHCQDIKGVERKLPLYEPPIDPRLAVEAAAHGISISSALNDLNAAMPNYRFQFLLGKAFDLCNEVKSLGAAFLGAKERFDSETLSLLQQKHETIVQNLVMEQKKLALKDAQESLVALRGSSDGVNDRRKFYLKQSAVTGEALTEALESTNLDSNTEFTPISYGFIKDPALEDDKSNAPNPTEQSESSTGSEGFELSQKAAKVQASAVFFAAMPKTDANAQPFGMGISFNDVLGAIQASLEGSAAVISIYANALSDKSAGFNRTAQLQRQYEDRVLQANAAGFELANIRRQIVVQKIKIAMAEHDITMQQKSMDNQAEVSEFLKTKHTNAELYDYQASTLKELYFQAYQTAYEWAKKAEQAFTFERGVMDTSFVKFGYWNVASSGLLAGEKLSLALKGLESAYCETRGYDYEITRTFSLRQINPIALMQLKETSTCEFELSEILFDIDFPGHYQRKLKSVSITIPAIVGPHTSINCTLRLLSNKFRTTSIAKSRTDYPEKIDSTVGDGRFKTTNVPISAIAVSTAQNDTGTFELNFKDERYLPFEGAGAVSTWRLELPSAFKQFDYATIPDVLISLKYTSKDGGSNLKTAAEETVKFFVSKINEEASVSSGGLSVLWDLPTEFSSEWYAMTNSPTAGTSVIRLPSVSSRLPFYTRGSAPDRILAASIDLFTESPISAKDVSLTSGAGQEVGFHASPVTVGKWNVYSSERELSVKMGDWELKTTGQGKKYEGGRMLAVVRYVLK